MPTGTAPHVWVPWPGLESSVWGASYMCVWKRETVEGGREKQTTNTDTPPAFTAVYFHMAEPVFLFYFYFFPTGSRSFVSVLIIFSNDLF